jgi:hypothetical protein
MKVVDLDMSSLGDAEVVYKVREDMARPDWHYQYRKLDCPISWYICHQFT